MVFIDVEMFAPTTHGISYAGPPASAPGCSSPELEEDETLSAVTEMMMMMMMMDWS